MKIGIIGAGGAARGIHIPGFRLCTGVEIAAICDEDENAARATGIEPAYTDYRDVLGREDIDAVVVATPNFTHPEIVQAAVAAGKHVLCEKPLALNFTDAAEMLRSAERAGVVHMTAFTYRYAPGIQYLKHLVAGGELGEIRTIRAAYLMALSGHLLGWRSEKRLAGSGVLADIGSHLIHLTHFVAGDIASLTALDRRFRNDPASDVEDWIAFLAQFANGACGTFEISRVCAGRGAGISEEIFIEVYGSAGSAVFSLQDPWGLMVALGEHGRDPTAPMQRVETPAQFLKLSGSCRDITAHDRRWGYRFDQAFQFAESVRLKQTRAPSFADGVRCQAVLDAALESSVTGCWVQARL